MKIVYIAGPYRATTPQGIEENIGRAAQRAQAAIAEGAMPITPHLLSRGLQAAEEFWLRGCIAAVTRCDEVWLVEGWQHSLGTVTEVEAALHAKNVVRLPDGRRLLAIERDRMTRRASLIVEIPAMAARAHRWEPIQGDAL